ncbi:unnamed protein product [Didymodactylos carnosus]|uniref:Uncharacterized protein n=1 Tax=Didymodactylos carnosus TaxID=1234261 RepID=A0A815USQ1_9BILA|nr:unnamed protein product [Didymodactylos carnosus]CAF1524858.1 unnamed protein product [Didymodactylos carnosus]CAF4166066.1 unnamed protein product [Didymodactylos carnosus]CAF4383857.1 unnamed protein product [Didymodactylos carnosus]
MGNSESTLQREEKRILRQPQQGEVSEFYWACRNGEAERVKELLQTIPYDDLNRLEPNGSTPLHAASYAGQAEVVRLLSYERGCRRDRLNLHGLTAYEEAASEEIRQLFHRPNGKNRFCEDESDNEPLASQIFKVTTKEEAEGDDDVDDDFVGDQWVADLRSKDQIEDAKQFDAAAKAISQSKITMAVAKMLDKENDLHTWMNDVRTLIHHEVTEAHPEFEKCISLLEKGLKEKRPEPLLRLYTLETPFYKALATYSSIPLTLPLYGLLDKLKPRHFHGTSYRGLKMTSEDLRPYRWALKKKGTVSTQTFCSTSLDRSVAERFAGTSTDEKQSVLMIFTFPTKCDTAINLGKLSEKLPCISEYEDEAEVLVLASTLFIVNQMDTEARPMTVHLENVEVKRRNLLSSLKYIYDQSKKQHW